MEAVSLNNKGVELLKKESPKGAQENFIDALALKPFEAAIHSNLGVSLDQLKEIDKAIQTYSAAEKTAHGDVLFATRFNLAQAIAKQGKVDEALAWYQKALDVNPTSIETKTNIELLTQQQKGGGGQGKNDQNKDQNNKDQNQQGQNDQDKKDKKDQPKEYGKTPKYQPRPFKGDLNEADVKKILGELKQQEQRIRADFNRKDVKEQPRDKDW
jgi:tetratricopeptide (TPR) repeat protein